MPQFFFLWVYCIQEVHNIIHNPSYLHSRRILFHILGWFSCQKMSPCLQPIFNATCQMFAWWFVFRNYWRYFERGLLLVYTTQQKVLHFIEWIHFNGKQDCMSRTTTNFRFLKKASWLSVSFKTFSARWCRRRCVKGMTGSSKPPHCHTEWYYDFILRAGSVQFSGLFFINVDFT